MKIQVIEKKGKNVQFISRIGSAWSRWGDGEPQLGESYDIELEIGDDFAWNSEIWNSNATSPSISGDEEYLLATGKFVALEDGECLVLDLDGTIIMLDVNKAPQNLDGFITFRAKHVTAFNTNI